MKIPCFGLLMVWLMAAVCVGCTTEASKVRGNQATLPHISQQKDLTINEIRERIEAYLGKEVVLEAFYGDPRRECAGIPYTRSDWMIYDETNAIYVSGRRPPGVERYGPRDWGTPLEIRGVVKQTKRGTLYISVIEVKIRKQ